MRYAPDGNDYSWEYSIENDDDDGQGARFMIKWLDLHNKTGNLVLSIVAKLLLIRVA